MKIRLIRNQSDGAAATLDIFGVIGMGKDGVYATDVRAALAAYNGKLRSITVRINSDGGNISEGLAIYNILASSGARVRTEVLSMAASMASVLMMSGKERAMAKNAWMMIHLPQADVGGESDDLRRMADILDKMRDQLARIYSKATGLEVSDIVDAMSKETWMTAEEALALGYATELIGETKAAARIRAGCFTNLPKKLQRAINQGENTMDPQILQKLGLSEDATLEDVLAAIEALQESASGDGEGDGDTTNEDGGDDDTSNEADGDTGDGDDKDKDKTAQARARREASQALSVNRRAQQNKRLDRLELRLDEDARDRIFTAHASKFSPALEKKARKWPLNVLREYVATAGDVNAEAHEPEADAKNKGARALTKEIKLSAEELRICSLTGKKPADVLAFKKAQAEKTKVA